jgi:hypothetical protein
VGEWAERSPLEPAHRVVDCSSGFVGCTRDFGRQRSVPQDSEDPRLVVPRTMLRVLSFVLEKRKTSSPSCVRDPFDLIVTHLRECKKV